LHKDDFLVLSVGELNVNKNQQVIIRAIAKLKNKNIHYILCGKGNQRENLERLEVWTDDPDFTRIYVAENGTLSELKLKSDHLASVELAGADALRTVEIASNALERIDV